MDPEKLQRKLLKEAAARRALEDKAFERRAKPTPEPAPVKLYCAQCLAMLQANGCPRCDHHKAVVLAYCRGCLNVHASNVGCKSWVPGRCVHCKTVHVDPLSDCPCAKCGRVHDGASGRPAGPCAKE